MSDHKHTPLPARLPCPFCGCVEISVGGDYPQPHSTGRTEAYCSNEGCGAIGPERRGAVAAIEAWNERPLALADGQEEA